MIHTHLHWGPVYPRAHAHTPGMFCLHSYSCRGQPRVYLQPSNPLAALEGTTKGPPWAPDFWMPRQVKLSSPRYHLYKIKREEAIWDCQYFISPSRGHFKKYHYLFLKQDNLYQKDMLSEWQQVNLAFWNWLCCIYFVIDLCRFGVDSWEPGTRWFQNFRPSKIQNVISWQYYYFLNIFY